MKLLRSLKAFECIKVILSQTVCKPISGYDNIFSFFCLDTKKRNKKSQDCAWSWLRANPWILEI